MPEYIDREALPLKEWTKTSQMFSDDIVCATGTDFLNDIAESENEMLFEIIKKIKTAPTADVAEVRHEKWIKDRNQYTCSECGYYYFANNVKDNFCARCGAKMDKESEQE